MSILRLGGAWLWVIAIPVTVTMGSGCKGGLVSGPGDGGPGGSGSGGSTSSGGGSSGVSGSSSSGVSGSSSSGVTGSSSGVPAGCSEDSSFGCPGGATAFDCPPGDVPGGDLVCSTPLQNGGDLLYCCAVGTTTTPCAPDDQVACPADSFGYDCQGGTDPSEFDPQLNCSAPVADPSGGSDYCCVSSGSGGSSSSGSSSGGVPSSCTLDSSLTCAGGATGYACQSGNNPEAEDSAISCSEPVAANGEDDFCCFTWTWGDTACAPDDSLTNVCPDPGSYGYQCQPQVDPSDLDALLTCSTGVPDPDGIHSDYCCLYGP
jgi:hypothetical protein